MANDRIDAAAALREVGIIAPLLLNKLELIVDGSNVTFEEQTASLGSARRALVQRLLFRQLRPESNASPEHPMGLCKRLSLVDDSLVRGVRVTGDIIPWIGLTDMSSPWANKAHSIVAEFKVIGLGRPICDTEVIMHRRLDDRSATFPTTDHLGSEEIRIHWVCSGWNAQRGCFDRMVKLRHLLGEPAEYEERTILHKRYRRRHDLALFFEGVGVRVLSGVPENEFARPKQVLTFLALAVLSPIRLRRKGDSRPDSSTDAGLGYAVRITEMFVTFDWRRPNLSDLLVS